MKIQIIVLALLFIQEVYADNKTGNQEEYFDFYEEIVVGEYIPDDIYLPFDPLINIEKDTKRIFYQQSMVEREAVSLYYPEHLNFLEFVFFPEILNSERCPNYILGKHVSYIRYVFRLLTISYLFETLKEYNNLLKKLGDNNTCSPKWEELFEQCQPQGKEMKKFLKRLKPLYLEAFNKNEATPIADDSVLKWRMFWCKDGSKCENIEDGKRICKESRKLIGNLCNEIDTVYGISYVPEMARILKTSNVMNIIDHEGYGIGCIDRFVSLFKDFEFKHDWLKNILPVIFRRNVAISARYIEGELFLRGALREFDEKGLEDFLFKVNTVLEPKRLEPKVVSIDKVMEIPLPMPTVMPSIAPLVKPVASKPFEKTLSEVKLSEFESKIKLRKERGIEVLALDMKAFSKDYSFDSSTLRKYDENLKIYYSRSALMDMLNFDKLGSKQEPVRLKFLKYLLDTDKHQGLFNLQAVIGEKFYVLNDFENKQQPQFIRLDNSEKTNYKWQISILED